MGEQKSLRMSVRALDRYGIKYEVRGGELFIDSKDWRRYARACDEGKLPENVC